MLEISKFIYDQQPVYWYALAGSFFLLGMLYASVTWRSWKRRLHDAERKQAILLDERQRAIEDRLHRQELHTWPLATHESGTKPTLALGSTPPLTKNASIRHSPEVTPPTPKFVAPANEASQHTNGKPTLDERALARARLIAPLFSTSYASSQDTPSNGPQSNGTHDRPASRHNGNGKEAPVVLKSTVRPNPWTRYERS